MFGGCRTSKELLNDYYLYGVMTNFPKKKIKLYDVCLLLRIICANYNYEITLTLLKFSWVLFGVKGNYFSIFLKFKLCPKQTGCQHDRNME